MTEEPGKAARALRRSADRDAEYDRKIAISAARRVADERRRGGGYWRAHGRPVEIEARRMQFYADCARVFGFDDWLFFESDEEFLDRRLDRRRRQQAQKGKKATAKRPGMAAGARAIYPLEELRRRYVLDDPLGVPAGADAAERRYHAGRAVRGLFEGAAFTGLRSADLGGAGGGGFAGKIASDFAIDCMKLLDDLKRTMPIADWQMLESMLREETLVVPEKPSHEFREDVRRALDYAAMWPKVNDTGGAPFMSPARFHARWPDVPGPELMRAYRAARETRVLDGVGRVGQARAARRAGG